MRAHIVATEAFRYTAEICRLEVPAGDFSFKITSTWLCAKDPTAERTTLQLTLDAEGLRALRGIIDAELRS